MNNLELPLGKRTPWYRFWEMIPAIFSYGLLIGLVILSLIDPFWAAVYLLIIVITMLVKAMVMAYHSIAGRNRMIAAERTDWHERLHSLEHPTQGHEASLSLPASAFQRKIHQRNLQKIAAHPDDYPKPSQVYHAVIIAAYNEAYDVIQPTIESVKATTADNDHIVVFLAYEERGGPEIEATAERLQQEYASTFFGFEIVKHPKDLPDEVVGKGPNITYAAYELKRWLEHRAIPFENVLVTTLDSDNKPHKTYFDYAAYEYVVNDERHQRSYQPIALYFGNIWDAPAPMRVVATGNTFWTIITSMRPHMLNNFASHSQPMDALVAMDFWSKRSIVEDGHQFWRSYFFFKGDYSVVPLHVPIYQDAVMADTYRKTLIAQFKQLRRWAYGASDVPFVATRLFSRHRQVPFFDTCAHFARLMDGHITRGSVAILVMLGGWVPLLVNTQAAREYSAHLLPEVVSRIQMVAMIGLVVTIFLTMRMLPPRPERYKRHRTLAMLLQWVLMPITAIGYNSLAAYNAQTHLLLGRYLDTFDVTDKATVASRQRAKQAKQKRQKRVAHADATK